MMEGREAKKFEFGNEKLISDNQLNQVIPKLEQISDIDIDDLSIENKEIDKKELKTYDSMEEEYRKTEEQLNRTYQD